MTSFALPRVSLFKSLDDCGTEETVRKFNNTLYVSEYGYSKLVVPKYEYVPLNTEPQGVRLLKLHPTNELADHVRCNLEAYSLTDKIPPFVAVKNARGYRNIEQAIEVDGQALLISAALERFLRYLRTKIPQPILIWVRYVCVVEHDLTEQSAYWTREFSDKMYALATEAIDMHDINNRLITNGYFEKVFHTQWGNRSKEWNGSHGREVILPRVCPVRLGTKPSIEAPTMDFRYMPLDMIADEIRVMCIMPAKDETAPIVIHVAHCPIKCEVTYIALSYRWGTEKTPENIVMNGQRMIVRRNLAEAIRALRMKEQVVPLWIDALSIDQNNLAERSREVPRMGKIYHHAMSVYSVVGPADDETQDVCEIIAELDKHPVIRVNDHNDFHFGDWGSSNDGGLWYGKNRIKPDRLPKLCAALYKFISRDYFRRCWILQEVAWASNPIILATGNNQAISFDALDKASYNLHDVMTRDPSLAGHMQTTDPSIDVDIDMIAYPRILYYFRYLVSKGRASASLVPFFTIKPNSPGFLEALVLSRNFNCTDPRDHIFSLWDLAQDKDGLEFVPSYDKPYEEIYTEFTRAWTIQHGSLDILGASEPLSTHSSTFYTRAPSWCPDWNTPATSSCLVRRDAIPIRFMMAMHDLSGKIYSTDGDLSQALFSEPIFSFDGDRLCCTGIIIDQIHCIFPDAPDIPSGTAPKSHWRAQYWAREMEKSNLTNYKDPNRAAWAMFHGDSVTAWPPVDESGYPPDSCNPGERYVCLPKYSRHVRIHGASYARTEAWAVLDRVLRGRRPFWTNEGWMGLAPAYLAGEDVTGMCIAVVARCSVPLILQTKEDGTYRLLGTCFVQGWMDGEWLDTMMGAENATEFWEAMMGDAKISIS